MTDISEKTAAKHKIASRARMRLAASGALACVLVVFALFLAIPKVSGPSDAIGSQSSQAVHGDEVASPTASSDEPLGNRTDSAGGREGDSAGSSGEEASLETVTDDPEIGAEYQAGVVLVSLADGWTPEQLTEALSQVDCIVSPTVTQADLDMGFAELRLAEGYDVPTAMRQLQTLSVVKSAQPNYVYHLQDDLVAGSSDELQAQADSAPALNDPYVSKQWALESIHAYEAWGFQKTEKRVTVAVLDNGWKADSNSGVDHEDLKANIVATYNAVDNSADVTPYSSHGTHVCGIIAAEANNGKGIAGVSYNAGLLPIQIYADAKNAKTDDIVAAIQYVEDHAKEYNIRVMNMSAGASQGTSAEIKDDVLTNKIEEAFDQGILTTLSVGNDSKKTYGGNAYYNYPSDWVDCALGVIALVEGDPPSRADYSNYNMAGQTTKDLSAPGSSIYSTRSTSSSGYASDSGTSYSAPCVAGVAALVFAANPELTPQEVADIICDTATDLGDEGWDLQYGAGEVNAEAAVMAALGIEMNGGSASEPSPSSGSASPGVTNNIASPDVQVELEKDEFSYTGKSITPKVTVKSLIADESVTLEQGVDYTVQYSNNTDVGQAKLTITGINSYAGTLERDFTITPRSLSKGSDYSKSIATNLVYTGYAQTPTPSLSLKESGYQLRPGIDYTVKYVNNTYAGTAWAVIVGKGNFEDQLLIDFKISKIDLSNATASMTGWTYDGAAHKPAVTVKLNGKVLPASSYSVTYANNRNAGKCTATIAPTDKVNYTGVAKATCTVSRKSVSSAAVSSIAAQTYSGRAFTPSPSVKVGGATLVKGTDYTLSYRNNVKPGTATVTITGKGNYTGSKSVTFKIAMPTISYRTHVQNVGWQSWKSNGAVAGTSGRSLRLEGLYVKLGRVPYSGTIRYRTHIQNIGWQGWRYNGVMSGTTGRSLRLEALQIQLTGNMAKHFDVYYRVHCQNIGWMGWAKNGASAGSAGYSYRLEAMQIKLVPKGAAAPGSTKNAFRQKR